MLEKEIQFDTPIVSIVYKRLDKTKEVYNRIREIKPSKLYVIADGPKTVEDKEKVSSVREFIDGFIDWPCEVHKRYLEKNIGLRNGIPSGLDWVFETEDRAIILEDDVVPELSFFHYCKQMLTKYENEDRVMMVSGFNMFEKDEFFRGSDITFSYFSSICGWATWKRAWTRYRQNIPEWKSARKGKLLEKKLEKSACDNYRIIFDDLQYQWYNTWDYQWQFAIFQHDGVGIVPSHNMIANIGINDAEGEHYGDDEDRTSLIQSNKGVKYLEDHTFVIPDDIKRNTLYDSCYQNEVFKKVSLLKKAKYNIRALIHERCHNIICRLEKDEVYFNNILPPKYKLSPEEQVWNNGAKYKEISAEELRFSAKAYLIYKLFKKDIYKRQ